MTNEQGSTIDQAVINTLIELKKSEYWPAIQAFNRFVSTSLQRSLLSVDPFKEPATTARTQGMHSGVMYLENEVEGEYVRRLEENKQKE